MREPTDEEVMRAAAKAALATVHTSLPGIVVAYNPAARTAVVQPAAYDGEEPLPPLQDIPVKFPSGGGYRWVFPLLPGDECTLHFYEVDPSTFRKTGALGKADVDRRHGLYAVCTPGDESEATYTDGLINAHVGAPGTEIIFNSLLGTIQIGSASAIDPIALATKVDLAIAALTTWAGAHVHSGGGSGPPVAPPPVPTLTGSLKIFGG